MKKFGYDYLIYYHSKTGHGTYYVTLGQKITKREELFEIQKELEDDDKLENVGIAHYQLIGRRKFIK